MIDPSLFNLHFVQITPSHVCVWPLLHHSITFHQGLRSVLLDDKNFQKSIDLEEASQLLLCHLPGDALVKPPKLEICLGPANTTKLRDIWNDCLGIINFYKEALQLLGCFGYLVLNRERLVSGCLESGQRMAWMGSWCCGIPTCLIESQCGLVFQTNNIATHPSFTHPHNLPVAVYERNPWL